MLFGIRLGGREKEFRMGRSIRFLAMLVGVLKRYVRPMALDTQKSISRCMDLIVSAA